MTYTSSLFFYHDTAATEIYTLSLHDALPISQGWTRLPFGRLLSPSTLTLPMWRGWSEDTKATSSLWERESDRKSTRLNSSHQIISYAVFCLKKKKKK